MHVFHGTTLTVSVVELHATIEAAADSNGLVRGDYIKSVYVRFKRTREDTPAPEDLGRVVVRPVGVAPPPEPAVVDGWSVVAVACPPPAPVLTLSAIPCKTTRPASPVAGALLANLTGLAGAVGGPCRKSSSRSDDALCERPAVW